MIIVVSALMFLLFAGLGKSYKKMVLLLKVQEDSLNQSLYTLETKSQFQILVRNTIENT